MPTDFPGGVDDIQNDVTNSTVLTDLHPSLHNDLADAIMALETQALAGGGTVADGSITSAKIADGTIQAIDLADGAVTSAKILDGTIDTIDLKDGAVTSAKIADGTIATADLANASVTNVKLASDTARANLLTNGGFEVWQRGNGPFTTNAGYTADRWPTAFQGTDTFSISANTANVDGNSNTCMAMTFVLGNGAGLSRIRQEVKKAEIPLLAGVVSFSVRVKTSIPNAVRASVDNFTSVADYTYSAYHTGSGNYETLTVSVTVTSATTRLMPQVNFAASCTAYIDNAMLVVGSVAADYAPLHPADDLARCQRYYEALSENFLGSGYNVSTTQAEGIINYATKGGTPTVTFVAASNFNIRDAGSVIPCTTMVSYGAGQHRMLYQPNTAGGLTLGRGSVLGNTVPDAIRVEWNP